MKKVLHAYEKSAASLWKFCCKPMEILPCIHRKIEDGSMHICNQT